MNISRIFILRPIATSLLMVALLLSGLLAYHYLPMAALPQIDYPTIQVQTLYPARPPRSWPRWSPRRWNGNWAPCRALCR